MTKLANFTLDNSNRPQDMWAMMKLKAYKLLKEHNDFGDHPDDSALGGEAIEGLWHIGINNEEFAKYLKEQNIGQQTKFKDIYSVNVREIIPEDKYDFGRIGTRLCILHGSGFVLKKHEIEYYLCDGFDMPTKCTKPNKIKIDKYVL